MYAMDTRAQKSPDANCEETTLHYALRMTFNEQFAFVFFRY